MIGHKILKLSEEIRRHLNWAKEQYYRIILFVAPSESGKSEILDDISKKIGAPIINVSLELTQLMLDLTKRQRAFHFSKIFNQIINKINNDVVILNNIEILFDPVFKQDPLRLLQMCSRNKTLIISWNGSVENDCLIYAIPSHPEYRKYPIGELIVIRSD